MNMKNEHRLFKKYPKLFPEGRKVDPRKSLMNFGMCVNDGWYNLIDKLCKDLITISSKIKDGDKIIVQQVKEKFGGLRFYLNFGTTKIFTLINKAERESFKTCEDCGKKGKLTKNERGWFKTLCKSCKKRK